jgi:hypothetical protein
MANVEVVFAVYGALVGGYSRAVDTTDRLQKLLNDNPTKIVKIDNESMDPTGILASVTEGLEKHFAAIVKHENGMELPFACQEGQTIDFSRRIP